MPTFRRIRRSIAAILVTCFFGILACSGDSDGVTPPETPTATGVWRADALADFPVQAPRTVVLTLQEANGSVSGTYTIAVPGELPYTTGTMTGTHGHPAIALTGTADNPDHTGFSMSGNFSGPDTIVATQTNNSLWVVPMTFIRQ